jgi:hypothetical protein
MRGVSMGIPTREQLLQALDVAVKMREKGEDDNFIAKSLLSLNYRFEKATHVIDTLKVYLHSGSGGTEHAKLIKAIRDFEKAQENNEKKERFGLE